MSKKSYPLNYPEDVMRVIRAMSFSKGKDVVVQGSMSIKSQQYAGDYDMTEVVKGSLPQLCKKFQQLVKALLKVPNLFIGDIKAGLVPEWRIIDDTAVVVKGKVKGYNAKAAKAKLEGIRQLLTAAEYEDAKRLLTDKPTPKQFFEAVDQLKFHIVRWKPSDVLRGHIVLRDGRHYTLEEAFSAPYIVKLDAVAFIHNNKFSDFSIIYSFKNEKGEINRYIVDVARELEQSYLSYLYSDNYFKAAKRLFSIAKAKNDERKIEAFNTMFNSDLGRLYSIVSDAKTIIYLLENEQHIPIEKIRYEIDQFRGRLGNIYSIGGVGSDSILRKILSMTELPAGEGRTKLRRQMESLVEVFDKALNLAAEEYLREHSLFAAS